MSKGENLVAQKKTALADKEVLLLGNMAGKYGLNCGTEHPPDPGKNLAQPQLPSKNS